MPTLSRYPPSSCAVSPAVLRLINDHCTYQLPPGPLSPKMSTAIHTPSHSPTTDFFAFRSPSRIANSSFTLSPCRQASATPPRKQPVLMLTPSPLRRRLDFDQDCDAAMQLDFDDFSSATGFSTPFHSPAIAASSPRGRYKAPAPPPYFHQPPSLPSDDEEGLFLRSNTGHTSLPLRTPERPTFDPIQLPNSVSNPIFSHAPKRKVCHKDLNICLSH